MTHASAPDPALRMLMMPIPALGDGIANRLLELNDLLREFRPHEQRPEYRTFADNVRALTDLYRATRPGGLAPAERLAIMRGGAATEKALGRLMDHAQRADRLDAPERYERSRDDFDGRYGEIAEKDLLDRVAAGEATVGFGSKGPVVRELQEMLLDHGAKFTIDDAQGNVREYGADGYAGPVTIRELEAFQERKGLEKTGRFDRETLAELRKGVEV